MRLWPRKRLLFARPNREMHFTLYKRLRCLVRIVICVCVRACTCVREWCMCERARVRACLRGLWVWHSGTKSVLGECERLGERGEGRESKRGWRECRRGEEGRGGECLCRPRVPSGPCWDLRPPVNTARPGGERRGGGALRRGSAPPVCGAGGATGKKPRLGSAAASSPALSRPGPAPCALAGPPVLPSEKTEEERQEFSGLATRFESLALEA